MHPDEVLPYLFVIPLVVLVFLGLRYVFLWYFRINERADLMKKQIELNQQLLDEIRGRKAQ